MMKTQTRPHAWMPIISLALLSVNVLGHAQTFSEISPLADGYFSTTSEDDFWVSSVAPADMDGDGDQDLAVLGYYVVYNVSVDYRLAILRNDGIGANNRWQYTETSVPLGDLIARDSDMAWGDYDGDGDHDLVVGTYYQTRLYQNNSGTLSDSGIAFPGHIEESSYSGAYDLRSITWADVDNDGDLDLFLPTTDYEVGGTFESVLMRNDGNGVSGWQFTPTRNGLDSAMYAQSSWIDDDGDGDLDLLMANSDHLNDTGSVRRFANVAGTFVAEPQLNVEIQYGLADWADVNADGRLDILLAGNVLDSDGKFRTVLRTYRAQALGGYVASDLPEPALPWLDLHAATWADYDSDGDVDLLATGSYVGDAEIKGRSLIYRNNGSGDLTDVNVQLPAPVSSIGRGGAFTWFDIDNDGDLDYLVAGAYYIPDGNGLVESRMQLFRNDSVVANAAPSAPGAPVATVQGSAVSWAWAPAVDDHTNASALTYELELQPINMPASGVRRLPEPGRLGPTQDWTITGLSPNTYQWRLRAVDSAWHSGTAASGTITIGLSDTLFGHGFEQ